MSCQGVTIKDVPFGARFYYQLIILSQLTFYLNSSSNNYFSLQITNIFFGSQVTHFEKHCVKYSLFQWQYRVLDMVVRTLCRRRRLKGPLLRLKGKRTGAEVLCFYYPKLPYCPDQMLALMLLSQHRVSSSKNFRPRAPCGA